MITIRAENAEDRAAVRRVQEGAFGRPNEADLVEALRAAAGPLVSLVAVEDGEVVGHVLFSPVSIEGEGAASSGMGLGPVAVLPGRQGRGVGSALIREGLGECRRVGHNVVVVLGHPGYYPRFGFVPAGGVGLRCEYPVPDEAFMVTELEAGALGGRRGLVKYRPEFAAV